MKLRRSWASDYANVGARYYQPFLNKGADAYGEDESVAPSGEGIAEAVKGCKLVALRASLYLSLGALE